MTGHCLAYVGFLVGFGMCLLESPSIGAQTTPPELATLQPASGSPLDEFGESVAIDGDVAVVASPFDDETGEDAGAVYVYRLVGGNWMEEAKLIPSDPIAGTQFGGAWTTGTKAVAVEGDVVVVGRPHDSDAGYLAGAAYVFRRVGGEWIEEAKLIGSLVSQSDVFGHSVAISGEVIVVGSFGEEVFDGVSELDNAGSAYVFRRVGTAWIEEQRLTALTPRMWAYFGSTVAIEGDLIVIAAPRTGAPILPAFAGAVYIFRESGGAWAEEQFVFASDAETFAYFGCDLSLQGNTILIGARGQPEGGLFNSGAAYVFRETLPGTWLEESRLTAVDPTQGDFFGFSVALSAEVAFVGVPQDDTTGDDSGSIQVFERNGTTWTWVSEVFGSQNSAGDLFGRSVSVSGSHLLVGAPIDTAGVEPGLAYVFGSGLANFIRGDADGDRVFSGLIDGAYALAFGFVPGSPAPPCMEAADADGSGGFSALIDGVFILNAQFVPGALLPPEPFPACGADPDPASSLGCAAGCP